MEKSIKIHDCIIKIQFENNKFSFIAKSMNKLNKELFR